MLTLLLACWFGFVSMLLSCVFQRLTALRTQARALASFIGLIQTRVQIDSDVYAKIMSIESLMAA